MKQYNRVFDEARKSQGFKSQAHLDAFFRIMDHKDGCAVCQSRGPMVECFGDMQPTMQECDEAKRLWREELRIADQSK